MNSFDVILLGWKYRGLNDRQIRIVDSLLIKGRITAHDCLKILKDTPRATINKDLRDLKNLDLIVSNGGSVNIFYTLGF